MGYARSCNSRHASITCIIVRSLLAQDLRLGQHQVPRDDHARAVLGASGGSRAVPQPGLHGVHVHGAQASGDPAQGGPEVWPGPVALMRQLLPAAS